MKVKQSPQMTANQVIKTMGLVPLPGEGGFFRETYRSAVKISEIKTAGGILKDRSVGTAIYYMVTPETFSSLHRLPQDGIFHLSAHPEKQDLIIRYTHGE